MNRIAIIANGEFPGTDFPRYLIATADAVVCCDGAIDNYLDFSDGRLPDAIVGDMDSIVNPGRFTDIAVKIEEQDDADIAKAVKYACGRWPEATQIQIFGATGKCEDHTIGNMSLLMEYTRMFDLKDRIVEMVTDHGTVFAATDTLEMECGTGRKVSIFSPDNSLKIKSSGLQWQTDDVVFDNWWKATLNRAVDDKVRLEFSHRSLALIMLD